METFIPIAHAATVGSILSNINRLIINPFIILLFVVALLMFLWGLAQFIISMQEGEVNNEGKQHMIWGTVGMLIMLSTFGIMNLIIGVFGFKGPGGGAIDTGKYQK